MKIFHFFHMFFLFLYFTCYAWQWPWKTNQAKAWKQKLVEYQARIRSLWLNRPRLFKTDYPEFHRRYQNNIHDSIVYYWGLKAKNNPQNIDIQKKELTARHLLDAHQYLKSLKNPSSIDLETLNLLNDWYKKYSNNRPGILEKQRR